MRDADMRPQALTAWNAGDPGVQGSLGALGNPGLNVMRGNVSSAQYTQASSIVGGG